MNSEEEAQNGAPPHEHHNLYKTVDVRPGCIHEVVIKNNDPKSVLTWDFDVINSDLYFTLYRTTADLPTKNGIVVYCENCLLSNILIFNRMLILFEDSSTSFFDLSGFEEGKNYFREEPSTICRHKESVQVSCLLNIYIHG